MVFKECFSCKRRDQELGESKNYYLPICDKCEKTKRPSDYEASSYFRDKCSFCEEDEVGEKGTVYRSLVVCCDCYAGPVKLREEYKERLREVKYREERCDDREKSNRQWAKKLDDQQFFAISKFGISIACLLILIALYAVFHGTHLGIDCFLCRWRWLLVMIGIVSFYWSSSIIADNKKNN